MKIDLYKIGELIYNTVTFDLLIKFVVLYFFIVWFALLLWVIRDITNRTNNLFLQIISILIVLLLTPLWIFIYLIIRPSKTLFEKYYTEVEDNLDTYNKIIEDKSKQIAKETEREGHCYSCLEPIRHDFKFCPNCKTSLKTKCIWCDKLIHSDWAICPYCWKQKTIIDSLESYNKFRKEANKEVKKILSSTNSL
jgi:hypothetical protein